VFSLLTSALVVASVSQINAEMIFFANGRTMSVKDYRVSGDTITVTLRGGGEATFQRSIVARIAPDEMPDPQPLVVTSIANAAVIRAGRTPLEARPFAKLIETVSLKHGIDPALVHAVIQAESNYSPSAQSHVGARGLFDPQENLETGVKYLKFLLGRFDGDLTNALAAYNAGPANVQKYDGIPPFEETQNYVRKVLSNFQQ
jgi:soluble lytic murein transglycosylase-like protein